MTTKPISASPSIPAINTQTQLRLQQAIDKSEFGTITQIFQDRQAALRPLANQQLPLNYAIRHRKVELVKQMLKWQPFDLAKKDFQGLSAIDHAMIANDPEINGAILQHALGAHFGALQNLQLEFYGEMQAKGIAYETNLFRTGEKMGQLPELHAAARNGDLKKIQNLYDPKNGNPKDKNGMTPIQHAALAGQKEVLNWLLQQVSDPTAKFALLHYAAIGGHADLIDDLHKRFNLDLNGLDSFGRRPLHYAMAIEDLRAAKTLIQLGANSLLGTETDPRYPLSPARISPLQVLLRSAAERSQQRDPLNFKPYEILTLVGIIGLQTIPYLKDSSQKNELLQYAAAFHTVGTTLAGFGPLKSKKSRYALFGSYVWTLLHGSAVGYRVYKTGDTTTGRLLITMSGAIDIWNRFCLGLGAFRGLKNAWEGLSLETYRPIRNAFAYLAIGADAVKRVYNSVDLIREIFSMANAWDQLMTDEGEEFRDLKNRLSGSLKCVDSKYKTKNLDVTLEYSDDTDLNSQLNNLFAKENCTQSSWWENAVVYPELLLRQQYFQQFFQRYEKGEFNNPSHPSTSTQAWNRTFGSVPSSTYSDLTQASCKNILGCTYEQKPVADQNELFARAALTLGLKSGYTDEECKKGYRRISLANHPDKNQNNQTAQAIFHQVAAAYEILDSCKR